MTIEEEWQTWEAHHMNLRIWHQQKEQKETMTPQPNNNAGTLFDSDLKLYWQIVSGLLFTALIWVGSWGLAIDSSNYYYKENYSRLQRDSARCAEIAPVKKVKYNKMGHCVLSGIIESDK